MFAALFLAFLSTYTIAISPLLFFIHVLTILCSPSEVLFHSSSVQFSSVTQLRLTLCDLMDCSMPGFSVHCQFLKLAQTCVHRVGDAIQPSISSSVILFSSCLQSFPTSGSFLMNLSSIPGPIQMPPPFHESSNAPIEFHFLYSFSGKSFLYPLISRSILFLLR